MEGVQEEDGKVEIRQVWSYNMETEFSIIHNLLPFFPYVAFDTEFPGTVFPSEIHPSVADPHQLYQNLKRNVDNTNIIQLGLTLSNAKGELPRIGKKYGVWEFNFSDFDLSRGDLHSVPSIKLLKEHGIDFDKHATHGISSTQFAVFLACSGLLGNPFVAWIGFHSATDFAYLVKMLIGMELPSELHVFMALVTYFFGTNVYDLKHMMKHCNGLYGGLEKVAKALHVPRIAGNSHQAGSDSLVTMMAFIKMRKHFFNHLDAEQINYTFGGVLHGLGNDNAVTSLRPKLYSEHSVECVC